MKRKMFNILTLMLALGLCLAIGAQTAIPVLAAPPHMYESYNTGDDSSNNVYGANWYAQTFTPSVAHTIKSVKLKLYKVGSPGNVTVSIRATSGGHPTGSDLCSGIINGNTLNSTSPGSWYEITLGSGYNLSASTMYAIVVRAPSGTYPSPANYLVWRRDASSPTYGGGCREGSTNGGSTWTSNTNRDMMFEEWGNRAPVLSAIGNKSVNESQLLTFNISATDADGDALTYSASNLPSGASFNATTRVFSWTPNYTQAGNYTGVHFEVTDGSLTASENITITVTNVNRPPVAYNQTGLSVNTCGTLTVTLNGSDPDGDLLTYKISALPTHGDLYDGTGTTGTHITSVPYIVTDGAHKVTYDPYAGYSGADNFGFKVNDGTVDSAQATISINISGCDDLDYYGDWEYYCQGDEVWKHQIFHDFSCVNGTCVEVSSDYVNNQLVEDCNAQDGWYDVGQPYACCDNNSACTCQDQEYRDYFCSGGSCTYAVNETRTQKTNCTSCDDGNPCTIDTCENGVCVHTPIYADILDYYRSLNGARDEVDTSELLAAVDDWLADVVPPCFEEPITTPQLMELIDEWLASD